MSKALTWNDLADLYDKVTKGHARTRPMEAIREWAEEQTHLVWECPEGYLYLRTKPDDDDDEYDDEYIFSIDELKP